MQNELTLVLKYTFIFFLDKFTLPIKLYCPFYYKYLHEIESFSILQSWQKIQNSGGPAIADLDRLGHLVNPLCIVSKKIWWGIFPIPPPLRFLHELIIDCSPTFFIIVYFEICALTLKGSIAATLWIPSSLWICEVDFDWLTTGALLSRDLPNENSFNKKCNLMEKWHSSLIS